MFSSSSGSVATTPRKWDAYKTLNIIARDSDRMSCVELNKWGRRCNWDISPENIRQVRAYLDEMERHPPIETQGFLTAIAQLSLCTQYHQRQSHPNNVTPQWKVAIRDAQKEFERDEGLQNQARILEQKFEEERAEKERLSREVDELKAKLRRESSEHEEAKQTRTEVQTRNETLTRALDQSRQDSERSKRSLTEQCSELSRKLAEASQAQADYKTNVEAMIESRTRVNADLTSRLQQERQAAAEYKMKAEADLSNQAQIIDELNSKLHDERKAAEVCQTEVSADLTTQSQTIADLYELHSRLEQEHRLSTQTSQDLHDLHSRLEQERRLSAQTIQDLNSTIAQQQTVLAKSQTLEAQFRVQHEEVEQLRQQLTQAMNQGQRSHDSLANSLEVQLSTVLQRFDAIEKTFAEGLKEQETRSERAGLLCKELDAERNGAEELRKELVTVKEELANSQSLLDGTKVELENIRKATEEQAAVVELRQAASAEEKSQLLERINQLEKQLSMSLLGSLFDRVKKIAEGFYRLIWVPRFLRTRDS